MSIQSDCVIPTRARRVACYMALISGLGFASSATDGAGPLPQDVVDTVVQVQKGLQGISPDLGGRMDRILSDTSARAASKEAVLSALETVATATPTTNDLPRTIRDIVIPDACRAQVADDLERVYALERELPVSAEESRVKDMLETEGRIADKLLALGFTEEAYLVLLVAHRKEVSAGLAGSERSAISYQLGRFSDDLLRSSVRLARVLNSHVIPLSVKSNLLANLREASMRGDLAPAFPRPLPHD